MSRNVVVTGGGTGIGKAVAAQFSQLGDHVTITGRREDVLVATAAEIGINYVRFDASDPNAVEAALPALPERVDVLVNAAGGNIFTTTPPATLAELNDLWLENLRKNLVSAALVTTALQDRIPDGGRIIHIGSQTARIGGGPYGAAKAGLEAWVASHAFEVGRRGITVNVISPGLTDETDFYPFELPDSIRKPLLASAANGRAATPADVAPLVAFVASQQASHITGQVLPVNGGASLYR